MGSSGEFTSMDEGKLSGPIDLSIFVYVSDCDKDYIVEILYIRTQVTSFGSSGHEKIDHDVSLYLCHCVCDFVYQTLEIFGFVFICTFYDNKAIKIFYMIPLYLFGLALKGFIFLYHIDYHSNEKH